MGKHSKRKASYLPKVAAGAAPLALLLAGPAAGASAADLTQPDLTLPLDLLPLDHQHQGEFDRDLGTTADGVHGSADLTRHDVYRKQFDGAGLVSDVRQAVHGRTEAHEGASPGVGSLAGTSDAESASQSQKHTLNLPGGVSAETGNDHRLSASDVREKDVTVDPAAGRVRVLDQDERMLGAGESTRHGVWLPQGIDVLSENSEQADTGARRSAALDASTGAGRFAGSLAGGLAAHRSSGQAIDVGDNAAFGTTSDQHLLTQFSEGSDTRGSLSGELSEFLNAEYDQNHVVGGHAGLVSGLVSTNQTANLGHRATAAPLVHDDGTLADSISGDLGIDHVIHVQDGMTTSTRGTLPDRPAGTVGEDDTLTIGVLDQPPTKTGLAVSAPPLTVRPH